MQHKLYHMAKDEQPVTLSGPAGAIEAIISPGSEAGSEQTTITVVICHPHPQHEGTMNNKVVTTMQRTFHKLGLRTIRFNFRGVGKSEGEFGFGAGELEDLNAVIKWAQEQHPSDKLWLAGFSFGAYISLCATASWPVDQLVSVALVRYKEAEHIEFPKCPWLLIQAGKDELVSSEEVLKWVHSLEHPPKVITIPGASHFFHGLLVELQKVLLDELSLRLLEGNT